MPRRWAALFSTLAGLVTCLLGAEMTFGQLRPEAPRIPTQGTIHLYGAGGGYQVELPAPIRCPDDHQLAGMGGDQRWTVIQKIIAVRQKHRTRP